MSSFHHSKRPSDTDFIYNSSNNPKKPRFDPLRPSLLRAEQDEIDEFEEDIGLSRAQSKRHQVRTDGYDSDSSQEGDKKREAAKSAAKRIDDKSDEDMFGHDVSYSLEPPIAKKEVKFLDPSQIEGQEDSTSPHTSQSSLSDVEDNFVDPENLDPDLGPGASRRAPPKIEAFNLRADLEEGHFDQDGNFIRMAKDPNASHDRWLEGVSKNDIRKAREAVQRREKEEREKMEEDKEEELMTTTERLKEIITILHPSETPLDALARMNQEMKTISRNQLSTKWKSSQKWKKRSAVPESTAATRDLEAQTQITSLKFQIERLTSFSEALVVSTLPDVYDEAREQLIRAWQNETEEPWRSPSPKASTRNDEAMEINDGTKWEYMWSGQQEIYGVFTAEQMNAWNQQGYFGDGVMVRKFGEGDEWRSSVNVEF